jgi:hypothetical protein
MKIIIYNPKTNLFDFFINSLIKEYNELNINILLYNDKLEIEYNKDILLIIINPHFIFDYHDIYNKITILSKKFKYKIFYITEPLNFIIEKKVYLDIIKMINPFAIWTYTYENFNKLNIKQSIFKLIPNNNSYHFINIDLNQLKTRNTNKIVFIGNITDNRKDICKSLDDNLINYNDSWTMDEWINILSSNLFYLNIHRRIGCKSFESFRIIPILANGGFIISERCNEIEENLYKDYNIIFVERNQIIDTFNKCKNNILYENIYNKCLLFRNKENNLSETNKFIQYYKNLL